MPVFTFDNTVHVGELIVLAGAARQLFKGAMTLRDAVREVARLSRTTDDHEQRLRALEVIRGGRQHGRG